MKTYKAYCFDLDGTVYRGTESIPEASALIARLQSEGIEPFFITNNSSMTQEQLVERLAGFGIRARKDHIMTSAVAAAKFCKENLDGAKVLMIGERGLKDALLEEGIEIVDKNPDAVVMGIDREITYAKLAEACLAIRAGASFIATNSDAAFPMERGLVPGNGSFVKLMETATGKEPIFVGKPESHMLHFIQTSFGFSKEDMIMIGDNYDTDIQAGILFGIDTAYVEGGVSSREDVQRRGVQPTYLFRTLEEWK